MGTAWGSKGCGKERKAEWEGAVAVAAGTKESCHHSSRNLHDISGHTWPARWVEGSPECSHLLKPLCGRQLSLSFTASALDVMVVSGIC